MLGLRDNWDSSVSCNIRALSACNHLVTKRDVVEFNAEPLLVLVMNFVRVKCCVEFILSQMLSNYGYYFLSLNDVDIGGVKFVAQ